jgi:hypothetical protein
MKPASIGILLLLFASTLYGQIVDNVIASFDGERVTVAYDLKSKKAGDRFQVLVYSSHDNYSNQIVVTGDAGEAVAPGAGKRVTWEAKNYLPSSFNEEVQIKFKVTPQYELSTLKFQELELSAYKKGRSVSMNWTGGNPNDKLTLELYKDNTRQQIIASNIDNNGNYNWKIPRDIKGKKYSFRLVNLTNAAQQAESNTFSIKSKTPLVAILGPVALVSAGAAYFMLGGELGD